LSTTGSNAERYPRDAPFPAYSDGDAYELAVRTQAGAQELLTRLGALAEIQKAVLAHCEQHRPAPLYRPQMLKDLLERDGWIREVRVPPFRAELDGQPINERYDMLKFFEDGGREVGVAIEMDNWMVHRDLLKFRRGLHRGQIVAGVIIQPNYRETHYCFEHFRHLNEPLFGEIPVLYCCPRGPGLEEPPVRRTRGKPFLMPNG
jgi:hypothetical protein